MNTTQRITSCILLCLFIHSFARGQVFVSTAGGGSFDGSSWANAHSATQLRAALRAAAAGTEFWIAAGTYTPHATVRDSFFIINSGVKVYGGFKGTETALSQRDWVKNVTILSGDIGVKGDSTDNSIHVVVFWYADSTTLLDGCTVTRGYAKADYGGGIYNSTRLGGTLGSFPTIRHCTITHNRASYGGGGIYNYAYPPGTVKMIVDSCFFEYNDCDSGSIPHMGGGAIFSDAQNSIINNLIVTNSTFQHNNTDYYGGAILMNCASATTLGTIKNCLFQFNTASDATTHDGSGAAINFETFDDYTNFGYFNVTVDSCNFLYNQSFSYGGAIYAGIMEVNDPVLTIQNCLFQGNSADNAAALFKNSASNDRPFGEITKMYLYNDIFRLNTVGIGNMGAIDLDAAQSSIDSTFMVNCLFDRNSASTIGNRADENGTSYISLLNCTIYDDQATAASSSPIGVLYNACYTSGGASSWVTLDIKNSILDWWPSVSTIPVGNGANSSSYIANSMIKGSGGSGTGWNAAAGTDMGGNIDVYPAFADTANYNLALRCASPCRDTANNAFITPFLYLNDLSQDNRIYNAKVDMGAYEYNAIPPHIMPAAVWDSAFIFTFENLSTGQEDSIEWTFGDGASSHYYPINHTYAAAGTYNVCLHIFSCDGDADSCFDVTVRLHTAVLPVTETNKYIIAPNPANSNLFISQLQPGALIELYNLSGSIVFKTAATQQQEQLSTGNLPAGIYLLRITDPQTGTREVHKIQVAH